MYSNSYDVDSHIWEIISRLEKPNNKKEYNYDKNLMVELLSLLLKFDWERSKQEIKGNKASIKKNILFSVLIFFFTFFYFYSWQLKLNFNYLLIIGFLFYFCYIIPKYARSILVKTQRLMKTELLQKQVHMSLIIDYCFMILSSLALFIPATITTITEILKIETDIFMPQLYVCSMILIMIWVNSYRDTISIFYNDKYYFFSIKHLLEDRNKQNFKDIIQLSNKHF